MKHGRAEGSAFETVKDALAGAAQELTRAEVESPHLTAQLLLAQVLGWDRVHVLSHSQSPVEKEQRDQFLAAVRRRVRGEPLQYITGEQEFYGITFRVTPDVLIPRPETEVLVEKAISLAANLKSGKTLRFVDVGTGSGCIAISVSRELPRATGWAVDISPAALAIARYNAARHQVGDRIQFVCADLLQCFAPRPGFDFILSNPPYVARADSTLLPGLVRDHEPQVALFSGELGLDACARLLPQAMLRLYSGGYFLMEIGAGQSDKTARLVEQEGLVLVEILKDLQRIPRCIVARKRE